MNSGSTVKLDVGGKIFKVYRSLIERYPDTILAQALGVQNNEDNDNNNNNNDDDSSDRSIFFDRNSERFGYILDYMRDGKVTLSDFSISKEALMDEFLYFGFKQIDPVVIKTDLSITVMADQLKTFELTYSTKISLYMKVKADALTQYTKVDAQAEKNIRETKLALYCLKEHIKDGNCCTKLHLHKDTFKKLFGITERGNEKWPQLWNGSYSGCCTEFGVKHISVGIEVWDSVQITRKMCHET